MSFKYDKLPNNDLFRIFELKPGKDVDPLHGNLRTFPRKEAPAYEALSYMWGSPDRVSVMKDIYSGSKLVTAWLGQADPGEAADTQTIISALAAIEFQQFCFLPHFPENKRLLELGLPTRESPAWGALNSMLHAPYFSRIWIIQELAVAPTYNLLWGDCFIPKVDFEAFQISVARLGMIYPDPGCLYVRMGGPSAGICPTIEWTVPMWFLGQYWKGEDLLELVSKTKASQATDPADKIFALIGLAGEKTFGIIPDYTKTKSEVFTEFALKAISETRNLKILNYCEVEDPTVQDRLPLWAPRWHHEVTGHYFDMTGGDFKSSNDMEISLHASTNAKVLQLKGLHIDKVKDTHSRPTMQVNIDFMAMSRMIMDHESLLKVQYGPYIIRPIALTMLNGRVEANHLQSRLGLPEHDSYLQLFTEHALQSLVSSFYYKNDGYDRDRRATIQLIKLAMDYRPP
ncbi:hypothetical protein J7337_012223 [Fusarium musae]|uniref:Heterokaryon incompatibility domain-containing protein n=1 Tax=Fusarium musae TaxID=1042133 RepID=A0A9P8D5G8_9HYPO|nr:hypothetical protein J7337_012223 [Fusarium musae]KAG9495669.1 hypothetical protein J7337_012223 [Fusarium musae]